MLSLERDNDREGLESERESERARERGRKRVCVREGVCWVPVIYEKFHFVMYLLLYSIERETGREKQIERRKNSHPMFFRELFLLWRVLLLCEMELEINEMTPLSAQINVHQCPPMGLGRIQLKNYESQQKNICCVVVTWHELGIWLEHNTTDVWGLEKQKPLYWAGIRDLILQK